MVYFRKAKFLQTLQQTLKSEEALRFGGLFGIFVFLWKGMDDILKRILGGNHPACGFISGFIAGASFLSLPNEELRCHNSYWYEGFNAWLIIGQPMEFFDFLLETPFDQQRFILYSAQVMYAYALHPTTLESSFYKFILSTGPITEQVLGFLRTKIRGGKLNFNEVCESIRRAGGDETLIETALQNLDEQDIIPCEVLHPARPICFPNSRWGFPVYMSLNFVPMMLLKLN
ncbi:hypothetical protein HK096_008398, partial [Nowakowskiella sp. JEL0078]